MEYKIKTTFNEKSVDFEMINSYNLQEQVEYITRWKIDVEEEGIREKLISLGWTPPEENQKEYIMELEKAIRKAFDAEANCWEESLFELSLVLK